MLVLDGKILEVKIEMSQEEINAAKEAKNESTS